MENLNLIEYKFDVNRNQDFLNLVKELYSESKHVDFYLQTLKKVKSKENPSFNFIKIKNFIAYREERVLGHISAMIDMRLDKSIGLIGFYECIDDKELSNVLLKIAINYLKDKNCKIIRAPVNLTIWHLYRFVVEQKDTFILEPITKNYYIKQFTDFGFEKVAEYGSGQRTGYETILPFTKPAYDLLIKDGFKIEKVNKANLDKGLLTMYEIAKKTFTDNWNYIDISKDEYMYLYNGTKNIFDNLLMEIVYNSEGEPIGFCSSIYDPIDKNNTILKSIAVLPEYQNKKVGAALIYSQHKTALNKGISKIIYALVRMGNKVTKLPYPGVEIIRKYVALELTI